MMKNARADGIKGRTGKSRTRMTKAGRINTRGTKTRETGNRKTRKKSISALGVLACFIIFAYAILLALPVLADEFGCCCKDGTAQKGSLQPADDCEIGYAFTPVMSFPLTEPGTICSEFCGEVIGGEFPPESLDCADPKYNPPPKSLVVHAVRGKPLLKLIWEEECSVSGYRIERCEGSGCTNFKIVASIGPGTSFTDPEELLFDTDYTYRMKAHYVTKDDSAQVTAEGYTGDIECGNQFSERPFCVFPFYYEQYEEYLTENGYRAYSKDKFSENFTSEIEEAFFFNFNKAFRCDERNVAVDLVPNCAEEGGVCVADESGVRCLEESDCKINPEGASFGLGHSIESCEGSTESRKFCFYDKSFSLVNDCYSCKTFMSCYDYRSRDSCERDNCAVGTCEWEDTYPELGIGVCKDARFDNCELCGEKGAIGPEGKTLDNIAAYNEIYDQCTKAKSDALSSEEHMCFFDPGGRTSKGCSAISCLDYQKDECEAPAGGIILDSDNNIISGSSDACGIGVCEYFEIIGECAKNADDKENVGGDRRDCAGLEGNARISCEVDVVPPRSLLQARGDKQGRIDYIDIIITDQERKEGPSNTVRASETYLLYLCTNKFDAEDCTDFSAVTKPKLNLNNLELKVDNETVKELSEGPNVLRFYAEDKYHNLEKVQELIFAACEACQGPKLINLTMEPGRRTEDAVYTPSTSPVIKASFNTKTILTVRKMISAKGEEIELAIISAGTTIHLAPESSLEEGEYTLRLFGRSVSGVEMDKEEEVKVVVDSTPPSISLFVNKEEMAGQALKSSSASIEARSDEAIIIEESAGTSYEFTDYAAIPKTLNLSFTESSDRKTHSASYSGGEGKNEILVNAIDLAGNAAEKLGIFYVHAQGPTFRIKNPSFGVSGTFDFDIELESHNPSTCTFWLNPSQPIPPDDAKSWESFAKSGGRTHSKEIRGNSRGMSADTLYDMHAYCYDEEGRESKKSFAVSIDITPPEIVSATADPDVVAETPFTTEFKIMTDDLTFCKYGSLTESYDEMEDKFPGFEIDGRTEHRINVTVGSLGEYLYYVACKNLAELGPAVESISFSVRDDVGLSIKPNFPLYSGDTAFAFGVNTNKRAFCFYESAEEGIVKSPLGSKELKRSHTVEITVEEGKHTYTVTCSTGGNTIEGIPETKTETIEFYVDTTPPRMVYVDDRSPFQENPELSYFRTMLQVKFNGEDDETEVTKYVVEVLKGEEIIAEQTYGKEYADKAFFIIGLGLEDKTSYSIRVTPVNIVGISGESLSGDGVSTDFSIVPASCSNGMLDPEEADVDCGGPCELCSEGKSCSEDTQCLSNKCLDSTCTAPSCRDSVLSIGFESDVDCGGQCPECTEGKKCKINEDCATGFCHPGGTCQLPGPCFNKAKDRSETDVDCGGSCPLKCIPGKNCITNSDCEDTSACVDVPSLGVRKCKAFPPGMRDSDGDGIPDDWEKKHGLDPNDPSDGENDPDEDGLTNVQEFKHNTDPFNADTDDDDWIDGVEVINGYDPLDFNDHPVSWWLWMLLGFGIVILAGIIAYGGYAWYQYIQEKEKKRKKQKEEIRKVSSSPIKREVSPEIERLRKMFGREAKPEEKIREKAKAEKEAYKKPMEKLRELAVLRFSTQERKEIARKLELLSEGRLSEREKEELFRKLRITAEYYNENKKDLQMQFRQWLKGKKSKPLKRMKQTSAKPERRKKR